MRDLGLTQVDEPFSNLLTQGMVLNEIFFRKPASGRIVYYNPADVDLAGGREGARLGAVLRADGEAGRERRHRHDVEVEEQRRRSAGPRRALRRRHARLFMMFAAPRSRRSSGRTRRGTAAFRFMSVCGRPCTST